MRAARLEKARKSIDYVLPREESALIAVQVEQDFAQLKQHQVYTLYHTILHYTTLYHTMPHYSTLNHTIPYYTTLYHTIPHYNTL